MPQAPPDGPVPPQVACAATVGVDHAAAAPAALPGPAAPQAPNTITGVLVEVLQRSPLPFQARATAADGAVRHFTSPLELARWLARPALASAPPPHVLDRSGLR